MAGVCRDHRSSSLAPPKARFDRAALVVDYDRQMSIRSVAVGAMRAARTSHSLRRFDALARGGKTRRAVCLVYGNCQAEPIRALLERVPEFADSYEAVQIPPVHLIRDPEIAKLQRVFGTASLVIAQPIKDGYRGLPLGMREMVAFAPRDCELIRFPALHYDALYPFQVDVHIRGRQAIQAPLTMYHDLRTLCAAAKELSAADAARWVSHYSPPASRLLGLAEQAAARIRNRASATDIPALDAVITAADGHARSFFTVNHPARFVLAHLADGVCASLGFITAEAPRSGREPLGVIRTPLESAVIDALGLAGDTVPDWVIKGKRIANADVVELHLDWYRRHREVMRSGLREHAERIADFGLLKPMPY